LTLADGETVDVTRTAQAVAMQRQMAVATPDNRRLRWIQLSQIDRVDACDLKAWWRWTAGRRPHGQDARVTLKSLGLRIEDRGALAASARARAEGVSKRPCCVGAARRR
jgi:hypothetical protein